MPVINYRLGHPMFFHTATRWIGPQANINISVSFSVLFSLSDTDALDVGFRYRIDEFWPERWR